MSENPSLYIGPLKIPTRTQHAEVNGSQEEVPYWIADDYCYDRRVGAKCLICEHTDCGNCPECSPEVPD